MSGRITSKGFTSPKLNPEPEESALRLVHMCIIVLLCNAISSAWGKQTGKKKKTWEHGRQINTMQAAEVQCAMVIHEGLRVRRTVITLATVNRAAFALIGVGCQ